jgi:type IV secretory pathway VirB10-like protein
MSAMSRWKVVALAALLGLTVALPAAAQWKWRDKNGQTQYSDLPPPAGVAEQDILQRPHGATAQRPAPVAPNPAASVAPLAATRASDPELEARRKKAEQEVLDKKKAEDAKVAAAKAENCSRAKDQMRVIDSGQRMARVNQQGEREYLDDAARAAEAKRTREIMASECK